MRWLRRKWTTISLYGLPALWGRRNWKPSAAGYELRSRVNRLGVQIYYRAKISDRINGYPGLVSGL